MAGFGFAGGRGDLGLGVAMVRMTRVLLDQVSDRRRCELVTVREALDLRNQARPQGGSRNLSLPDLQAESPGALWQISMAWRAFCR